jgi:hypothetical protein
MNFVTNLKEFFCISYELSFDFPEVNSVEYYLAQSFMTEPGDRQPVQFEPSDAVLYLHHL